MGQQNALNVNAVEPGGVDPRDPLSGQGALSCVFSLCSVHEQCKGMWFDLLFISAIHCIL